MSTRIALPITWIREMGISIDARSVSVSFDGENIIISPSNIKNAKNWI
ncbi:MAG: hypothetical protein ACRCST_17615 [Turicibacter sp.]